MPQRNRIGSTGLREPIATIYGLDTCGRQSTLLASEAVA
jgi:hypothetical protein